MRRLFALAVLTYIVSASFHISYGGLSVDEGFYAIASRSVMQGEVPYRDFGYTQMPLLPYVNGPFLSLIGYGLYPQRLLNGLWGLLSLIVAGMVVRQRTSPGLGLLLVLSFSLSASWMYFVHLGKTYAFTGLIVMLATLVFLKMPANGKKFWLLSFLGVVGAGCRLPSAPFFAILWAAALWHERRPRARDFFQAGAAVVFFTGALLLPFYLIAPESSWFWPVEFQWLSVLQKRWYVHWTDILLLSPGCWVLLAFLIFHRCRHRNWRCNGETIVGVAALLTIAANVLPAGAYQEYGVPFVLPLACALLCELYSIANAWPVGKRVMVFASLGLAHLLLPPLIALQQGEVRSEFLSDFLPSTAPEYNRDLPVDLARAKRIVEQILPPGRDFIGPNIILAAETGHPVPRNLRMGSFTTTRDFPPDKAQRLHLITYPEITALFADPNVPLVAFFPSSSPNYSWSMPSFQHQPALERLEWATLFREQYLIVEESREFLLLAHKTAMP